MTDRPVTTACFLTTRTRTLSTSSPFETGATPTADTPAQSVAYDHGTPILEAGRAAEGIVREIDAELSATHAKVG